VTQTAFDFSTAPAGLTDPSGLEWDPATGLLYGHSGVTGTSDRSFVSIDPANGMVSHLGALPQPMGWVQGESTFGGSDYYAKTDDGQKGGDFILLDVHVP